MTTLRTPDLEVVLRAADAQRHRTAVLAVARLLSLLPTSWSGAPRTGTFVDPSGDVVLALWLPTGADAAQARTTLDATLADSALNGWHLVELRPVSA